MCLVNTTAAHFSKTKLVISEMMYLGTTHRKKKIATGLFLLMEKSR